MPVSGSENADGTPRADDAHASRPQGSVLRVSSPVGLLAAVPVVLKFAPSEPSIVVLGVTPPRSEVAVTARYDIQNPGEASALARHAAGILAAQHITTACAVGYGPGEVVTPVADALRATFAEAGIIMTEFLCAQDGRYWSYVCASPACCPPEGTQYDLSEHPVTRNYGHLVLASREDLAATLAPVTGEAAEAMRKAVRAARQRAKGIASGAGEGPAKRRALLDASLQAVTDAIAVYREGGKLGSHEDAAWLALALKDLRVRDDAWARMDPAYVKAHMRLWTDLTVLAPRGYAVAPAALLAFTAWQDGDGALGNVALDRALAENPRYSMAELLRDALDSGAPPSMARLPMTPEEVAAAYGHDGTEGDEDEAEKTSVPENGEPADRGAARGSAGDDSAAARGQATAGART